MYTEDRRRQYRCGGWFLSNKFPSSPFVTTATVGSLRIRNSNPKWKSVVASGGDATTAYTNVKLSCFAKKGFLGYIGRPNTIAKGQFSNTNQTPLADCLNVTGPTALQIETVRARAALEALKKIRAQQYSYSGLTIIGEFRQSLQMLRSPFKSLLTSASKFQNHLKALKRKHVDNTSPGYRKLVSDSWLEYSFGVQPLLNDVFSVMNAMNDIELTKVTPVRGVFSLDFSSTGELETNCGDYMFWRYTDLRKHTCTVKYVCGVLETDNTDRTPLSRAVEKGGFTLSEVVPAAWELVPWSFLIDYFINVGDVLEATVASTRNVSFSSRTDVVITDRIFVKPRGVFKYDAKYYYGNTVVPFDSYGRKTTISRRRETPYLSIMSIQAKLPFKSPIRDLNMAALFDRFLAKR